MTNALRPMIDMAVQKPQEYEALQRKAVQESGADYAYINKVLYYTVHEGVVDLHILPSKTLSEGSIASLLMSGLREVAQRIKEDASLIEVCGTSWIVYQKQEYLEGWGFTITHRNDQEGVATATISRDKFLEKFNKKK